MLSVMVSEQNASGIYEQPQLYIFPGLFYILGLTKTVAIRKANLLRRNAPINQKTITFQIHTKAILSSTKNIVPLCLQ